VEQLGKKDGTIIIYYGGHDTVINIGLTHEDVLATLCNNYGHDPQTGRILYNIRKNLPKNRTY